MKLAPPQFEVRDRALVWVLAFVVLAVIANRTYGIGQVGATRWWIGFAGFAAVLAIIVWWLLREHRRRK
jgi:hypothetical protein